MPAVAHATQSERRTAFAALKAELSAQNRRRESTKPTLASAIPELDRLLCGGFPEGAIATLEGATGRWSVAAALAATTTRRGLVAIVDDGSLYPPGLVKAGVALERVIVVPAKKALQIARAVDILLRARICRLVLMPAVALRDAVWTRLATLAQRSGAVVLVMATRAGAALSAVAEMRVHCALERALMYGTHGVWGCFAGFKLSVDLRKHRFAPAGDRAHLDAVVR
jgi:hypothetical protein